MARQNRRRRLETWEARERTAQQAQRQRLADQRRARQLALEAEQPETALSAVQQYRDAKRKRLEAGKPVMKSVEEWRTVSQWLRP